MILKKVDRSKYKEYMEYAEGCKANRVYPLSIACGTQEGDIYTDNNGCVLFWHYCGFAYLSGDPGAPVLEEIYQKLLVAETERRFILITDSESVTDHYSGRDRLRFDKRIEYDHGGIPEKLPELDDSFAVEFISAENIADIQGRITPAFSWKDSDTFLRDGFGLMARSREDRSFAAVAFSAAVSPEEVDIGVETAEAYRHHGLASYLAYRMCGEITDKGKKAVWAHAETNEGSRQIACSAGFRACRINTVIHKKIFSDDIRPDLWRKFFYNYC